MLFKIIGYLCHDHKSVSKESYQNTKVIQKVLRFTQILDLLYTYPICISLIGTKIKTEIQISFSSFKRNDSILSLFLLWYINTFVVYQLFLLHWYVSTLFVTYQFFCGISILLWYINSFVVYRLFLLHINSFVIYQFFCGISILLWYIHIYPTPPLGQDMTQGQFLSGV